MPRKRTTGTPAFEPAHIELVYVLLEGRLTCLKDAAIAKVMNCATSTIRNSLRDLQRWLGVSSTKEIIQKLLLGSREIDSMDPGNGERVYFFQKPVEDKNPVEDKERYDGKKQLVWVFDGFDSWQGDDESDWVRKQRIEHAGCQADVEAQRGRLGTNECPRFPCLSEPGWVGDFEDYPLSVVALNPKLVIPERIFLAERSALD